MCLVSVTAVSYVSDCSVLGDCSVSTDAKTKTLKFILRKFRDK